MELENALEAAVRLRDAIAAEIESARSERQLLRTLDAPGLFDRATQRSSFLAGTAQMERTLRAALSRAASSLGLREVTLDKLRERAPGGGAALTNALSEVRSMAAALNEIDQLNRELANRALAVVRGYVDAVQPTPRAYDRHGGRAATAPALAVVSSKG